LKCVNASDCETADYPTPDAVYAADPVVGDAGADPDTGPSQRPLQTATPLALRLGRAPITRWATALA